MKDLNEYSEEELRNELKRRNYLKKIERENRAQCKNCIHCHKDRGAQNLYNRYICTESILGKVRKHYRIVRNKKNCDKFEKRNHEMLNISYYIQ